MNRRWTVSLALAAALSMTAMLAAERSTHAAGTPAAAASGRGSNNPFCSRLGHSIQASAGAQLYCFGAQSNGPGISAATSRSIHSATSGSATATWSATSTSTGNVDAASLSEDVTQSGARVYGQSETSVAAAGNYAVEAWNDATSAYSPCPSPMEKEEATGLGFSSDGGRTFTDLGGLPNDCTTGFFFQGDPSVEVLQRNGGTYFYVSSLYVNVNTGESDIGLDACQVTGSTLTCAAPVIAATGASGFLDKDFLAIDPGRSRLYVTYTRFDDASPNGQIELALCDLSSPGAPVCYPDSNPMPYFVVAAGDPNCEQEGAYPAVDRATGAVYVAWEFNWFTGVSSGVCQTQPTQNMVAFVPFSCLPLAPVSPCSAPVATTSVNVLSMELANIAGYNRFPMNDWPRIAVSDPHGTVSIVWNDARFRPLGDILLQSWHLGAGLRPVQTAPAVVDSKGGAHFLPGLRLTNAKGNLVIGWYERPSNGNTYTSYAAGPNVNPASTTASAEVNVTSVASNWPGASSDLIPNFGDYTDVYTARGAPPDGDDVNGCFAWADGRLADPQPFSAQIELSS